MSQLILQPFRRFTYVTAHSPILPLLHLRHSSFSNPSLASFTYVTTHSATLRLFTYVTAHSPILPLLHIRHSSFSNPSFASPTSQALHLIYLASRPWTFRRNSRSLPDIIVTSSSIKVNRVLHEGGQQRAAQLCEINNFVSTWTALINLHHCCLLCFTIMKNMPLHCLFPKCHP